MMRKAMLLLALVTPVVAQQPPVKTTLWDRFRQPADDARPLVRWWWFGPAVEPAEIDREIAAMKAGGFGGFEVQPVYPLSPDDLAAGIRNRPYLSDAFLSALRHSGDTARANGMRIDVTLGSGWPFGGPHVVVTQAAAEVRRVVVTPAPGAARVPLPALGPGERLLAAFADGRRLAITGGAVTPSSSAHVDLFIAGRTGQQVKRAAIGAEGYVIDHVSPAAVTGHLTSVGDRLLSAFAGTRPPDAIFSDSLEAYGSSWTDDLPQEFRRRRGYDLLDHLPALFGEGTASAAVRFDWSRTLSELVDERYLRQITAWAHSRGTRFRAQVYGFPPPTLSSNALVDLPEGEGADWRRFTSTRWATSAAHLYDRPVVSSETWTWLHSPSWAATPLDMKVEADRHFLQGVNQIVGHGWPYSPPGAPEPGWAFYAAAALSDHNPWYAAMPAVTGYLQRVSAMLREGRPDADVALYLPIEDAFADMRPAKASVNEEMHARLGDIVAQVLDAGHGVDFIDAQAVVAGRLSARVLVLPALTRIDPAAYRAIAGWVGKGGKVIALGAPPGAAGGLLDGGKAGTAVRALSARLFARGGATVVQPAILGATLNRLAPPAMALARPDPAIGFVRRRLPAGNLYFIVNTGPRAVDTHARFAGDDGSGEWWDPLTGAREASGGGDIALRLAPYQSRLLVFAGARVPAAPVSPPRPLLDLSTGWEARVVGSDARTPQPGTSWTSDAALIRHSGAVRYTRSFVLPTVAPGPLLLDFGESTPLPEGAPDRPRAALMAPVREAAVVRINGRDAGTVWAAPWRLDIAPLVRAGENRIEVIVMNGAANALSALPPPDRRLLTLRYGERFQDQDRAKLAPQPSGLLGRITLLGR